MFDSSESPAATRPALISQMRAAVVANMTRRQFAHMVADGKVRTMRVGARDLVVMASLDALIDQLNDRAA